MNRKKYNCDRSDIYHHAINLSNNNDPRQLIYNNIQNNTIVLDVGCACGDLGVILKENKHCSVYGIDNNRESLQLAQQTNSYKKLFNLNLDQIEKIEENKTYQCFFDYIVLGDVLEHTKNHKKILCSLESMLKKNGFFLISLPNIAHCSIKANLLINKFEYTPSGLLDITHVHFFTQSSICQLMSECNLLIKKSFFTATDTILGFQENNPYKYLNDSIKKRIFSDLESFVCQYVFLAQHSSKTAYSKLINLNDQMLKPMCDKVPKKIIFQQKNALATLTINFKLNKLLDSIRTKIRIRTRLKKLLHLT